MEQFPEFTFVILRGFVWKATFQQDNLLSKISKGISIFVLSCHLMNIFAYHVTLLDWYFNIQALTHR